MSLSHVKILRGAYGKKRTFHNETHPLTKVAWQQGNQWFVEIQGTKDGMGLEDRKCRIKIDGPDCIEYCDNNGAVIEYVQSASNMAHSSSQIKTGRALPTAEELVLKFESDEDTMARIRRLFEIQDDITKAVCEGVVRGLIISGPPGIGKSHGVEGVLKEYSCMYKLAHAQQIGEVDKYRFIKGTSSAFGLYIALYHNSSPGDVIVFDDCDYPLLYDDQCLNLLKSALDSGERRTLNWNTDSKTLKQEDIPSEFEFKGCVIFLTNTKFDTVKGRTKEHIDALLSRCHYLDLEISTVHEKILRIKQVVADGMLNSYNFSAEEQAIIVDWIQHNQDYLREVSLRTVIKVADLYRMDTVLKTNNWEEFAEATVLMPSAKFTRIVQEKGLLALQAEAAKVQ